MVTCCETAAKVYIPPEGNYRDNVAMEAKVCIEQEFGLPLTDWTVLWFQPGDPEMRMEFLTPAMV